MLIAILSSKGGSGKSTLASNLARGLQLSGKRVLIIETDRQSTLLDWSRAAQRNGVNVPEVRQKMPKVVRTQRNSLLRRHDVVVIDGASKATEGLGQLTAAADLVLCPVRATQPDAWAAIDTVKVVNHHRGSRPACFVLNQWDPRTRVSRDIDQALVDGYGWPVLPGRMATRIAYSEAFHKGGSVIDLEPPSGKARKEIEEITRNVLDLMSDANRH